MASLRMTKGPLDKATFPVDRDPITLGRLKRCGIYLPHATVSREHARLEFLNQEFRVTDLGSANGTFVNDEKVQESVLGNGDRLRVGDIEFAFTVEAGHPSPPPPKASPAESIDRDIDVEEIDLSVEAELPPESPKNESRPKGPNPNPAGPKPAAPLRQLEKKSSPRVYSSSAPTTPPASGGLLKQDLDQQPLWRRLLMYGVALVIAGAVFMALFQWVTAPAPDSPDDSWDYIDETEDR